MTLTEIILSVLGLVGIGGIASSYLNRQNELAFKILENKERRYKSCLLYMDVFFKPSNIKYLSSRQIDIQSSEDVIEYLKAEYHEMILYASRPVILCLKKFIEHPSKETFLETVLEMRTDLWSKKRNLTIQEIELSK